MKLDFDNQLIKDQSQYVPCLQELYFSSEDEGAAEFFTEKHQWALYRLLDRNYTSNELSPNITKYTRMVRRAFFPGNTLVRDILTEKLINFDEDSFSIYFLHAKTATKVAFVSVYDEDK